MTCIECTFAYQCQATHEEEIFEVQDKQSLFPLGWIHVSILCFNQSAIPICWVHYTINVINSHFPALVVLVFQMCYSLIYQITSTSWEECGLYTYGMIYFNQRKQGPLILSIR